MTAQTDARDRAVRSMFDDVARRYDLLNRIISFRLDHYWRNEAVAAVRRQGADLILDLGAGTGDLTFAAARCGATRVVGLDFSLQMLRLAQQKKHARGAYGQRASFVQASALFAPFKSGAFDAILSAFVLRNISDLKLFFSESERVLKPGGMLVTLDMFPPPRSWFSALYGFYFYRLVPWIGRLLSDNSQAYRYLSESVRQFQSPAAITELIRDARFETVQVRKFLSGAVCMHVARKSRTPATE
jgi:demethylmenaquinone methyltransferase/2-methoxy-6-polyprenyl-1,4-benzoquinol methylase